MISNLPLARSSRTLPEKVECHSYRFVRNDVPSNDNLGKRKVRRKKTILQLFDLMFRIYDRCFEILIDLLNGLFPQVSRLGEKFGRRVAYTHTRIYCQPL